MAPSKGGTREEDHVTFGLFNWDMVLQAYPRWARLNMSQLLDLVADTDNLKRAFIQSRKSSWTSDGLMGRQFIQLWRNWDNELTKLQSELLTSTYTYSGADAILVPGKKKPRGVYSSAVRDRWVQQAVYRIIRDSIPSSFWSGGSYGRKGRKGIDDRSIQGLAGRVRILVAENQHHVYETDIKDFFPSIDKDIVVSKILECLPDESLTTILTQMVNTEISRFIGDAGLDIYKHFWNPGTGVPQGGILSPLFANVYLNDFDLWVEEQGWLLFRYVDDILIFCSGREEVVRAANEIPGKLGDLNLSIHPLEEKSKTFIRDPGAPVNFVGLSFSTSRVRPSDECIKRLRKRVSDLCGDNANELSLLRLIEQLNNLLEGWSAAYRFCEVPVGFLRKIDKHIAYKVGLFATERGILASPGVLQDAKVAQGLGLLLLADLARVKVKSISETEPPEGDLDAMKLVEGLEMITVAPRK